MKMKRIGWYDLEYSHSIYLWLNTRRLQTLPKLGVCFAKEVGLYVVARMNYRCDVGFEFDAAFALSYMQVKVSI